MSAPIAIGAIRATGKIPVRHPLAQSALIVVAVTASVAAQNPDLVDDVRDYIAGLRSTRAVGPAITIPGTYTRPPDISLPRPAAAPRALGIPPFEAAPKALGIPPFEGVTIESSPPGFLTVGTPPELSRVIELAHVSLADQTRFAQSLADPGTREDIAGAVAGGTSVQKDEYKKLVTDAGVSDKVVREIDEIIKRMEGAGPITDRQRHHQRGLDESARRRQMVAEAAQALVVSQGFSPQQSNDPEIIKAATLAALQTVYARDVGGATDIPKAPPADAPARGGAPDRPDPRVDPRADPIILDDPLMPPSPRTIPAPDAPPERPDKDRWDAIRYRRTAHHRHRFWRNHRAATNRRTDNPWRWSGRPVITNHHGRNACPGYKT